MNGPDKLNQVLIELTNLQVVSISPYLNSIQFTFSNGTKIRTSAYSYKDAEDIKHNTSIISELIEEEFSLLTTAEEEFSLEIEKKLLENSGKREDAKSKCQETGERLQRILESHMPNLSIKELTYKTLDSLIMSFNEIENLYLEFYAKDIASYNIDIETSDLKIYMTTKKCIVLKETIKKDYKSFSSAVKSRFRVMAKELGYEQITGITYVKERDGWYETFNLQSSQYGNPFFYFNYGVILSENFPMTREELRDSGWNLGGRLGYKEQNSFPAGNKKQIEESAAYALEAYKEELVPWFESLSLEKIKKEINK